MAPDQAAFLRNGLRDLTPAELPHGSSCSICLDDLTTTSSPSSSTSSLSTHANVTAGSSIAISGFNPRISQIIQCNHNFHHACLLSWLGSSNVQHSSCPNCRVQLFPSRHARPGRGATFSGLAPHGLQEGQALGWYSPEYGSGVRLLQSAHGPETPAGRPALFTDERFTQRASDVNHWRRRAQRIHEARREADRATLLATRPGSGERGSDANLWRRWEQRALEARREADRATLLATRPESGEPAVMSFVDSEADTSESDEDGDEPTVSDRVIFNSYMEYGQNRHPEHTELDLANRIVAGLDPLPALLLEETGTREYFSIEQRRRQQIELQVRTTAPQMTNREVQVEVNNQWSQRTQFVRDLEHLESIRSFVGMLSAYGESHDGRSLSDEQLQIYGALMNRLVPQREIRLPVTQRTTEQISVLESEHAILYDEVRQFFPYSEAELLLQMRRNRAIIAAASGHSSGPLGPEIFRLRRFVESGAYHHYIGSTAESVQIPPGSAEDPSISQDQRARDSNQFLLRNRVSMGMQNSGAHLIQHPFNRPNTSARQARFEDLPAAATLDRDARSPEQVQDRTITESVLETWSTRTGRAAADTRANWNSNSWAAELLQHQSRTNALGREDEVNAPSTGTNFFGERVDLGPFLGGLTRLRRHDGQRNRSGIGAQPLRSDVDRQSAANYSDGQDTRLADPGEEDVLARSPRPEDTL